MSEHEASPSREEISPEEKEYNRLQKKLDKELEAQLQTKMELAKSLRSLRLLPDFLKVFDGHLLGSEREVHEESLIHAVKADNPELEAAGKEGIRFVQSLDHALQAIEDDGLQAARYIETNTLTKAEENHADQ